MEMLRLVKLTDLEEVIDIKITGNDGGTKLALHFVFFAKKTKLD